MIHRGRLFRGVSLMPFLFLLACHAPNASLTGHWSGHGKKAEVELDLIACDDARCLFRFTLSPLERGYSGWINDLDASGVFHRQPAQRTEFDYKRDYSVDLSVEGSAVFFEASDCRYTWPSDRICRHIFPDLPERVELRKTSDSPSFSPSFDCAEIHHPFEEEICRQENWARLDRRLGFEHQEFLGHLKDPAVRAAFEANWLKWRRAWAEECAARGPYTCITAEQQAADSMRKEKEEKGSCAQPLSGFQSVLCANPGLAKEIEDWNRGLEESYDKNKRGETTPYALANENRDAMKLDYATCYEIAFPQELEGCLRRKLARNRARLDQSRISSQDWKWMLSFKGFDDWPPGRLNRLAAASFAEDHSTAKFFSDRFEGAFKKLEGYLNGYLGPGPSDIRVKDDRYLWISGCRYDERRCLDAEGFLWVDTQDKKIILGTCADRAGITGKRAKEDGLPGAFISLYQDWRQDRDELGVHPPDLLCEFEGPYPK